MVVVVIAWYAATACRDEAGNGSCGSSGRSCRDSLLLRQAVGDDEGLEVEVIDIEQEVGKGKAKDAEGE